MFSSLRETWGEPSVVVYNAAAAHFTSAEDPLSVSVEDFELDLNINTTSAYVAAKEAVDSFSKLPESAAKCFLYTGNCLNEGGGHFMMTCGVGKSATARFLQNAALSYKAKGFRFFYVDERTSDGKPALRVSGPDHAEFFAGLIDGSVQAPWQATFVKGEGYKKFERIIRF